MRVDPRRIAIGIAGYCAFINLYSPQALLPLLRKEFGVGAVEISALITSSTLAIALTAPFTGAIADVLGRKRVITAAIFAVALPMVMVALAPNVPALVFWRFIQGLMLPPIFAVTIAYIGDEWPPAEVAGIAGIYTAGSSLGGFSGRFLPGMLADLIGWRTAFIVVALLTVAGGVAVALMLRKERGFVRSPGLAASGRQMLRHLRNPQLIATYAVGFGVLFNFIATFTYVSFHLAAPPYNFSAAMLGAIFFTYLMGTVAAPFAGRAIGRFGRRRVTGAVIVVWICGASLMLLPQIWTILAGLTLCAACGLLCQAVSTGYVTLTAKEGRSSAVGLYVTCFYVGGALGGFLPGIAWSYGGWSAAVTLIIAMLMVMGAIVTFAWRQGPAQT